MKHEPTLRHDYIATREFNVSLINYIIGETSLKYNHKETDFKFYRVVSYKDQLSLDVKDNKVF